MNNKSVSEDWRVKLAMPLFLLIDWLLAQPKLALYLFDKFRTKDNIRKVLTGVYPHNPGAVDDALVDLLHGPSEDEGALETFCSILSGPPGPRPEQLLPQLGSGRVLCFGEQTTCSPLLTALSAAGSGRSRRLRQTCSLSTCRASATAPTTRAQRPCTSTSSPSLRGCTK